MNWFKVSVSDSVKSVDSQTAIALFIEGLKNKSVQTIVDNYEVSVEEEDAGE